MSQKVGSPCLDALKHTFPNPSAPALPDVAVCEVRSFHLYTLWPVSSSCSASGRLPWPARPLPGPSPCCNPPCHSPPQAGTVCGWNCPKCPSLGPRTIRSCIRPSMGIPGPCRTPGDLIRCTRCWVERTGSFPRTRTPAGRRGQRAARGGSWWRLWRCATAALV